MPRNDGRRNAIIASAVAVPITVVLAFAFTAGRHSSSPEATVTSQPNTPLPRITESAPPANPGADADCTKLLQDLPSILPSSLGDMQQRPVTSSSPYVLAWGEPAVVLRCGVPRPEDVTPQSTSVWFPISGASGQSVTWDPVNTKQENTFTTVDRAVYIQVTVPTAYRQPPLAQLSDSIAKALPAVCDVGPTVAAAEQCVNRTN